MIYVLERFLSPEECEAIVEIMREHMRPSTVTFGPADYRTSTTCDLSLIDNPAIDELDTKICRTVGIWPMHSEGIQAQHYEVGQEFKPHTDYFEPGTDEYRDHCMIYGNRTWTFMCFLNTVEEGGETVFPMLQHGVFQPLIGRALYWNNLKPDGTPNPAMLHAGLPVIRGHKDIVTKWFREKPR